MLAYSAKNSDRKGSKMIKLELLTNLLSYLALSGFYGCLSLKAKFRQSNRS